MSGLSSKIVAVRIGADPAPRLDKALAREVPEEAALSRSRLGRLIAEGAVAVNGHVTTDAKAKPAEGDRVEITLDEAADVDTRPEDIALDILHEDADLIVVNKPAGMVVHPAPGTPTGTLVNALLHHFGGNLSGIGGEKRPGIVHRIDKDTSGLLVVAKSDRAHHGLAAQFEKHSVERHYLALCHGEPSPSDPRLRGLRGVSFEAGGILKITTQLARHKTDRQRQAVLFSGGRHAVTRARVEEGFGAVALAELLAGNRTHPPDPGASGPCRPRAGRRPDLWRAAQGVGQGARCGSGARPQRLPPAGAACRLARLHAPGHRRSACASRRRCPVTWPGFSKGFGAGRPICAQLHVRTL